MKLKTQNILAVMHVLSWIVCCGLVAQAGAILISYTVSIGNPEGAKNLYLGLNLYTERQYDFWQYTWTVGFMVVLLGLKAYIAALVAKVLSTIKMASPFTAAVSKRLERISYFILVLWVITMLYDVQIKWVMKALPLLEAKLVSGEFILLAGVIFIMAQIFKKGVEIQSENELTV